MAAHLTCSWCTNESREILARGGSFSRNFLDRVAADMRAERDAEPTLVKCSLASCTRCGCEYHAAQYFRQLADGAPLFCITHYLRLEQMHRATA